MSARLPASAAPLLITPGDPEGIGPEVSVRAARALGLSAVLVGDCEAIERVAGPLPRLESLGSAERPMESPLEGLFCLDPSSACLYEGEPIEVAAIRFATMACLEGRARALVTGPIHKARLAARGFQHAGHTDFLGELCGVERPVMAFVGGELRVALVTVHIPLSAVPGALTAARIGRVLDVVHAELQGRLGLSEPRQLVCGLNPHAGDSGLLGREEIDTIGPACEAARARGLHVSGPISAEAAFRVMRGGGADIVIAMYHDQGLAPLKLVDFGRSVNWTMGLPIIRTSVDHGTADDIAGRGLADPESMKAAIRLAAQLSGG